MPDRMGFRGDQGMPENGREQQHAPTLHSRYDHQAGHANALHAIWAKLNTEGQGSVDTLRLSSRSGLGWPHLGDKPSALGAAEG